MKVKNVALNIQNEDEFIAEIRDGMKAIVRGENIEIQTSISFESIKSMRRFITDERPRILKTIKKYNPESIYELAKILKRDLKNVSDDVHYLSELGLIEIQKTKEGRNRTRPVVDYEKILVEISV